MTLRAAAAAALALILGAGGTRAAAHDGPPYPIVSERLAGPYEVSIWTDPDATDDGSASVRTARYSVRAGDCVWGR